MSDDMNAFVRVVEKGSFAAAAQDLALTPSAVSKIVTRIEQRLGVQLLTRTTRRIALTPEGETYFRRCRDILAAIEAAEAEVASSGTSLQGHIRVSASTSVGRYQIAPILPAFLGRHPGIAIELDATDRQIDLIVENVDVALRTGQLADSSLVARKISEARRIICASPAYLERAGNAGGAGRPARTQLPAGHEFRPSRADGRSTRRKGLNRLAVVGRRDVGQQRRAARAGARGARDHPDAGDAGRRSRAGRPPRPAADGCACGRADADLGGDPARPQPRAAGPRLPGFPGRAAGRRALAARSSARRPAADLRPAADRPTIPRRPWIRSCQGNCVLRWCDSLGGAPRERPWLSERIEKGIRE